jgi:protein-S-isoprenylcysteine O-methyltransferase Ste14
VVTAEWGIGMSRIAALIFAIACYAVFFATFLYLIVFVGDFSFASVTVDNGPLARPLIAAAVDIALIALFGLQHSVMARPAFKQRWTRIVPHSIERSVYVLCASIALLILFLFWRPIDTHVWSVSNPVAHDLIWFTFWAGWATVLISTFLINHFELFGLQQAWAYCRGEECPKSELRAPFFYKWVAHPIYAGFFLAFWAVPTMTVGHLLLAAGLSAYMLIAIRHEERDLIAVHGDDYRQYRAGVGMLFPRIKRRDRSPAA